jgi:hypothetical protein
MVTPALPRGADPRESYALPARTPVRGGHQEQRPEPWSTDRTAVDDAAVTTIYVPADARARQRARVLEQLAEGRRRRADYRARGREWQHTPTAG